MSNSYNLRRRRAHTVDTVPGIQTRPPSAAQGELNETVETDAPVSTQATGHRTPARSSRRSSSEASRASPLTDQEETAGATPTCGHALSVEAGPDAELVEPRTSPHGWSDCPVVEQRGSPFGGWANVPAAEQGSSPQGGWGDLPAETLLTKEQMSAVRVAESQMDDAQRQAYVRRGRVRDERAQARSPSAVSNEEPPGPSARAKGKTVDPRDWGGLANDPDLNLEGQRRAFEAFRGRGRYRTSNRAGPSRDFPPHQPRTETRAEHREPPRDELSEMREILEQQQKELEQMRGELSCKMKDDAHVLGRSPCSFPGPTLLERAIGRGPSCRTR
jgi:hypothetical protein